MADVKWIKIVTDIFDDEKILLIESMPEADSIIVIWFKLLCLAGRQNNSGVFTLNGHIPYTEEMFSTIFRRPLNTVRLALKTFEMYGMIEIINDTVTIPNWGKHQSIEQIEARREYQRNYQRQYYAKQKALAEGKQSKRLEKCLDKDLDKQNINTPDKNRLDKNRKDKDSVVVNDYNPFGDPSDAPDTPQQNSLLVYAEANLKSLSYGNRNELMRFMEKLPEDVIRHVIDETCAVGVSNWAYVRKVLRSYIDDGITTMAQVEAREKQREEERKRAERNRQAQQAAEENPLARAKFY